MIAYRIQDKSRGVEYLIDLYDEDYTLTYDQLVELAEEWVEQNN